MVFFIVFFIMYIYSYITQVLGEKIEPGGPCRYDKKLEIDPAWPNDYGSCQIDHMTIRVQLFREGVDHGYQGRED